MIADDSKIAFHHQRTGLAASRTWKTLFIGGILPATRRALLDTSSVELDRRFGARDTVMRKRAAASSARGATRGTLIVVRFVISSQTRSETLAVVQD